MTPELLTATEVGQRLDLHVKTVLRYIREGRLKAVRIGKEYRITADALRELAGSDLPIATPVVRTRHVLASCIVDVDAISPDESRRVTTMVMAALNAPQGEAEAPRVDTIYYEERARLRITITASPALVCDLLRMIDTLLGSQRKAN